MLKVDDNCIINLEVAAMRINDYYEDEKQEFKKSLSHLDNGIDSLSAMLNKHCTGTVYFGVDNNGEIVGLSGQIGEETLKKISTRITEILKPSVLVDISCQLYGDKMIIRLSANGNKSLKF